MRSTVLVVLVVLACATAALAAGVGDSPTTYPAKGGSYVGVRPTGVGLPQVNATGTVGRRRARQGPARLPRLGRLRRRRRPRERRRGRLPRLPRGELAEGVEAEAGDRAGHRRDLVVELLRAGGDGVHPDRQRDQPGQRHREGDPVDARALPARAVEGGRRVLRDGAAAADRVDNGAEPDQRGLQAGLERALHEAGGCQDRGLQVVHASGHREARLRHRGERGRPGVGPRRRPCGPGLQAPQSRSTSSPTRSR